MKRCRSSRSPRRRYRCRPLLGTGLGLWLLLPQFLLGQPTFLPAAATTALGIDTLAAGEPTGGQQILATLEPLDAELSEALVTVYLLAVEGGGTGRLTAILDRFDEAPDTHTLDLDLGQGLSGCNRVRWVLPLPEDYRELAIVLETETGWGAAPVVGGGDPPATECPPLHRSTSDGGESARTNTNPEERSATSTTNRDPAATSSRPTASKSSPSPPEARQPERPGNLIRILPVRGDVKGPTRFRTVVTSEAIDHVEFYLDGELSQVSKRAPHSARLDLGPEVVGHRIEVIAKTSDGVALGGDRIEVNAARDLPRVVLTRVETLDATTTEVEAEVQVPRGTQLDRLEWYWNQDLVLILTEEPFRTALPTPATGSGADFLRVVAHYQDGSWVEDVRLLGAGSSGEEISVNLVELYAVLTDRDGNPIRDLDKSDLAVRSGSQTFPIERFQPAEDLSLSLGLIVDTSESMWTLMPDTKRAAAMFLSRILSERDRAFLVDFDNQPRLARASTGDVVALVTGLGGLVADGATAMFDAIAFASLQFDNDVGRRALVLLTDGDDYKSKLGINKALQQARQAGAPVYVIGLGGLDGFRRDLKTIDIETIAQTTGGRVFLVESMEALGDAYSQIEADLRGQYLIAFSTPQPLSSDQLAKLKVKSGRRDLDVRVVVSPHSQ